MNHLVATQVEPLLSPKPRSSSSPLIIPAVGTDGLLFPIEKLKAHEDGTLHLAVSIFVFCGPRLDESFVLFGC